MHGFDGARDFSFGVPDQHHRDFRAIALHELAFGNDLAFPATGDRIILGSLDGVLTGIRQLRRVRPLETENIEGLRVPTLAEMARVKAWLLATRMTTRDYLDTVVIFERLGEDGVRNALASLDELYPQPSGASVLAEVTERLGAAQPADAASVDLGTYRNLEAPWNDWQHVASRGRAWARVLADLLLGSREDRG